MQYYIKIYNKTTNELVGYYKETGHNCITKMQNGMKYFNDLESALNVACELDEAFVRDKDKHYYTAHAVIYGDSKRKVPTEIKKNRKQKEEELKDALDTFIRQNSNRD